MKKLLIPALLAAAVLIALGIDLLRGDGDTEYRLVEVTRGDVRAVVTSTEVLQAITTVQVGTQVSGKVSEIYADFNDRVTKGQLIARIDPILLEQAVRSAEADLARNRAELAQKERVPRADADGGKDRALLWTLGEEGNATSVFARTGLTDGQYTEVTGPNVHEGMPVIAAIATSSASTGISNPFQSGGDSRRRGPPGL